VNSSGLESLSKSKVDNEDFPGISSSETDDDIVPGGETRRGQRCLLESKALKAEFTVLDPWEGKK